MCDFDFQGHSQGHMSDVTFRITNIFISDVIFSKKSDLTPYPDQVKSIQFVLFPFKLLTKQKLQLRKPKAK